MIESVRTYLVGIAIGIRFGPNFSIRDDFGNMADKILYKKDSFFNEKMFPVVGVNPAEISLNDDKSGDSLVINSRDIVLTCNIENQDLVQGTNIKPKIKLDMLPELNKRFEQDIIEGVLKEYKFNRIRRIGYINKYVFNVEELSKRLTSKIFGETIGDVTDVNLRFSKKYPVPEAMVKKNVNDYHNVIFNITKKADKDEVVASLDYQAYYEPVLESMKDVNFDEFLGLMEKYNSGTFLKWLNEHFGE